ncbi:hypothetical protein niasHS_011444 [Heterodera schachtii]|uniref:Uncharacterized protein n=1 Tax=Heterodera schachtii TaxID=97005 RepID=A0ABD2IVM9_HETSC
MNNNGKNSNNCDSADEARRSRKRDRVDVLHEVEMDKIREEKRRRRQRRKNEEVQRQRALLRLRTDYRNARCAVATGQYRMSCTGSISRATGNAIYVGFFVRTCTADWCTS